MKKLLSVLVTTALVLGLISTSVIATPMQKLTNSQVQQYEQLGFTPEEMDNLSDEEINRLSGKNGKLVSKVTKYYRVEPVDEPDSMTEPVEQPTLMIEITKEQALKEVQEDKNKKNQKEKNSTGFSIMSNGSGSSSNSWLTMTTTVTDLGNKRFYFKNSFTWLTTPSFRMTDALGMSHNASISTISGSAYVKVTHTRSYSYGPPAGIQEDYYWTPSTQDVYGEGFKIQLRKDDAAYIYTSPRGYMISEGLAAPSNYVGPSNAYGHYKHQQFSFAYAISRFSAGLMAVSPTTGFDVAPDTNASFYIN